MRERRDNPLNQGWWLVYLSFTFWIWKEMNCNPFNGGDDDAKSVSLTLCWSICVPFSKQISCFIVINADKNISLCKQLPSCLWMPKQLKPLYTNEYLVGEWMPARLQPWIKSMPERMSYWKNSLLKISKFPISLFTMDLKCFKSTILSCAGTAQAGRLVPYPPQLGTVLEPPWSNSMFAWIYLDLLWPTWIWALYIASTVQIQVPIWPKSGPHDPETTNGCI